MLNIKAAIALQHVLQPHSDSPKLDIEILLMHILQCERATLYTYPEKILTASEKQQFQNLLLQRMQGEPIAYLIGKKAFWDMELVVSRDTLIPRPETELLVETALELLAKTPQTVVDIATGSGAIALVLAKERPAWTVLASDISFAALKIAQQNIMKHQLTNLQLLQANWGDALMTKQFDLIIANPPYVAADDPHLKQGDVQFEPQLALTSANYGLAALQYLIETATNLLKPSGWIILEHGYAQGAAIRNKMQAHCFKNVHTRQDLQGLDRMTAGQQPHE